MPVEPNPNIPTRMRTTVNVIQNAMTRARISGTHSVIINEDIMLQVLTRLFEPFHEVMPMAADPSPDLGN